MIEQSGDMFYDYLEPDVMYVITTNGFVKNDGTLVMGAGIAKDVQRLQKNLPAYLGDMVLAWGNRPYLLPGNLATLPVKHHWKDRADIDLINTSLRRLRDLWSSVGRPRLYLPRPGCGNGKLSWYSVRPFVEDVFGNEEGVTVWTLEETYSQS